MEEYRSLSLARLRGKAHKEGNAIRILSFRQGGAAGGVKRLARISDKKTCVAQEEKTIGVERRFRPVDMRKWKDA